MRMIRFKGSTMIVALLMAWLLVAVAATARAAYSVKKKWAGFSATAGEALATGDLVCIKDADGYAYEADADDSDLRPAVGIVGSKTASASGATVEIITTGVLGGWTTLTEGQLGYLSDTASAVTQSAPSWSQPVGVALSTTEYYFNFSNYFDSSSLTSLGTLTGATPIICEGATADAYETTFGIEDPTADRTVTVPNQTGTMILSPAGVSGYTNAVWGESGKLTWEGATQDAYESSIAVTDPTADRTFTLPDATGYAMISNLSTNAPDAANSVWGASNGIAMEGATADDYETTMSPEDPTADRTFTLPNYSGTGVISTLSTNKPDAANSVWGASNGIVFEGATADDYETTMSPEDPTADRTFTLPNYSGTGVISTLSTNKPDAANSVWGASNGIVFEGATANGYETTLQPADPASDITITIPQYDGDMPVVVGQDYTTYTQAGSGTSDGSSWTIPANTLAVGTALRIKAAGTLTGGNNAPTVHLYIDNAQIVSLTFPAATAGDWVAEFVVGEHTDTANQKVYGRVDSAAGAGGKCDYAVDTTDTTSAFVVKLQLQAANAGDTIAQEMGIIEFLP